MIDIKPFKQTDDSRCGPACIKMVLDYYGIEATEDEICERCNWTYELGCTNMQMFRALESYGLTVLISSDNTLGHIKYWIGEGVPIIVDWFSPGVTFGDMPEGHASVVVDIDDENVYLLDPEPGKIRVISHNDFMRVWFDWREGAYLERSTDLELRTMIVALKM